VIQAIKLGQLAIKKFLSPNLALLVDNAHTSVIGEVGKNVYEKLHDLNWDIRDSAIELLYVVTDIAEISKSLMERN
jgi:BRCA1-associated ATM activator 1